MRIFRASSQTHQKGEACRLPQTIHKRGPLENKQSHLQNLCFWVGEETQIMIKYCKRKGKMKLHTRACIGGWLVVEMVKCRWAVLGGFIQPNTEESCVWRWRHNMAAPSAVSFVPQRGHRQTLCFLPSHLPVSRHPQLSHRQAQQQRDSIGIYTSAHKSSSSLAGIQTGTLPASCGYSPLSAAGLLHLLPLLQRPRLAIQTNDCVGRTVGNSLGILANQSAQNRHTR